MKTRKEKQEPAKKPYTKPRLVKYGEVRLLTQTSTTGSKEGTTGSGIMKPGSDRAIKENIVRIGDHPLGFGLYLFDYKPGFQATWGAGRQFGVMADEVEAVVPQAVSRHPEGYKVVDHAMLAIRRHFP
jgi:hypothetical protein